MELKNIKYTQKKQTMCCDKEMVFDVNCFNGQEIESLTCLKCGFFETKIRGTLDDDELENMRELQK